MTNMSHEQDQSSHDATSATTGARLRSGPDDALATMSPYHAGVLENGPIHGVLSYGDLLSQGNEEDEWQDSPLTCSGLLMMRYQASSAPWGTEHLALDGLPNEMLLHILSYLDVSDLLATSRTSHHLRTLSLAPILHHYRLRRTRFILPPLLSSPGRPSLADLIRRSIFLTHTTVVSRQLGRSLASIRLAHRLAARPPASALIERSVLPAECAPGAGYVAPAIVAKKRAVEKERVKDGLRRWVAVVWKGEVRQRSEGVKQLLEGSGD